MRRQSTGFLLGLGMFVAGLAYSAFCLELTVLNSQRVTSTAKSILESAPVQRVMADNIDKSLSAELGDSPDTQAAINRAAGLVVHDARFQRAFTTALQQFHRRLFDDPTQSMVLDTTQTTPAIREALNTVDPTLAARVSENASIDVSISNGNIPDLRWLKNDDKAVARIGGLLALALIVIGLAVHSHPAWAVGKIGRWLLMIGLFELLIFFVLPHVLLAQVHSDWAQVVSSVGGEITKVLIMRALILVGLGALLIATSVRLQRRAIRRQRLVAPEPPDSAPYEYSPHEILPGEPQRTAGYQRTRG